MTTPEYRKRKEYSQRAKTRRKEEVDYCCEGCGRKILTKRTDEDPQSLALESHHDDPIIFGGDRTSPHRILCGPRRCHEVADIAGINANISFGHIVDILGPHPFQTYLPELEGGQVKKVAASIIGSVRRIDYGIVSQTVKQRRLFAS